VKAHRREPQERLSPLLRSAHSVIADIDQAAPIKLDKPKGNAGKYVVPLSQESSGSLRDQLLVELASLKTLDDLTLWALRRMNSRNTLHEIDAEQINQVYLAKLSDAEGNRTDESAPRLSSELEVVPLQKTVRRRSKSHLTFVASQSCMVCNRRPCDAHHLKFSQPRALGRKVSDEYTVPLCREHHSELHRHGNEHAWWVIAGLAPVQRAAELWDATQQREAEGLEAGREKEGKLKITWMQHNTSVT
jgi:hypothetical protein